MLGPVSSPDHHIKMLEEDLDDDTHLCYKCSQTIVGLENYIRHRKSQNCSITKNTKTLQVDDHTYGTYDFNETNVVNYDHDKSMRSDEPEKSITDSLGYNYGLGADIFFSSLQLQSISKDFNHHPGEHHHHHHHATSEKLEPQRVLTRKATAAIMAHSEHSEHGDDWIDESTESDKLLNAVSDISGNKKVDEMFQMIEYDDNNETEGESSDEMSSEDEEYYNVPPRTHTGGKWKPDSPVHSLEHHWSAFEPSTSGKWKPSIDEFPAVDTTDYTQALWMTPTYKSNELHMDKIFAEQFWCNICNRKLASRLVYERHLKSKFHIKRSLPEAELEEASRPENNQERLSKRFVKPSVYLNNDIYDTDFNRSTRKVVTSTVTSGALLDTSAKSTKKKRNRRHIYIKCDVCRTRLPSVLIGKHLISHYHYRRMLKSSTPDASFAIILSNMEKIVKQSPFQCQMCRFYATTQEMFLRHWNSNDHLGNIDHYPGRFWCSFCMYETDNHSEMTSHLSGYTHQETLLGINRSVPIIIRKKTVIKCDLCPQEFRYNFELRKHTDVEHSTKDAPKESTASDSYQSKYTCGICNKICESKLSLQKHEMKDHKLKRYFCRPCDLHFTTPEMAKIHRTTTEHKIKSAHLHSKANLVRKCEICNVELADILQLKQHLKETHPEHKHSCPHCGEQFQFSQEVSRHVRDKKCKTVTETAGKNVEGPTIEKVTTEETVPDTITVDELEDSEKTWSCKTCAFTTQYQSELIYHEILHSVPNLEKDTKISCPYCSKFFQKFSLRAHLRQHTNERQFQCDQCSAAFARKSNLKAHVSTIHEKRQSNLTTGMEKTFQCSFCQTNFAKNYLLKQHLYTHREQITMERYNCHIENCIFSGRSDAELRNHLLTHSEEKNFHCDFPGCDYKGKMKEYLVRHTLKQHKSTADHKCQDCSMAFKTSWHLKRHKLTHTGEKPFKCPHCDYSCNNIGNLRKHVITTTKHRGRNLYECRHCKESEGDNEKFTFNYAKEYKTHLLIKHNMKSDSK